MSAASLNPILKSVSRSFYLSLRFLPPEVRKPISIAYLLARASDTIADSCSNPPDELLATLKCFQQLLEDKPDAGAIATIQTTIKPDHLGEQALLDALPECLEHFHKLKPSDRKLTLQVMRHIIEGQSDDLQVFAAKGECTALPDAAALEHYTYCVAGSVGEFWTRVCLSHFPKYSTIPDDDLLKLAVSFGKVLQLVNILRDLPEDLKNGRCYLPADELKAAGVEPGELMEKATTAQPVFDRWLARAEALLIDTAAYINAIRQRRVRFACAVPYLLAVSTLQLLRQQSPLQTTHRLKVPRSKVRQVVARSAFSAFFGRKV